MALVEVVSLWMGKNPYRDLTEMAMGMEQGEVKIIMPDMTEWQFFCSVTRIVNLFG